MEVPMGIHLIAGFALSVLIGLSLGLIGSGSSTITVPILVYVIGINVHQAVATSLVIVGITNIISTGLHYRQGTVKAKTGGLFAASGIPGAYFGSHFAHLVSQTVLLFSFALLMISVGSVMMIKQYYRRDMTLYRRKGKFRVLLT
ncbi:MAG: sulfite exporter TauE/SafE family protein [wastewater metagenome]|nr:sulfite exporter TauE/SafE family protein [Candidatus Loosdrechtia aerotolerans]